MEPKKIILAVFVCAVQAFGQYAYSVVNYGARGDGSTNSTAAIQATIDSCPASGCIVDIPEGQFLITSQITVAKSGVILQGHGRQATQLLWKPTSDGNGIVFAGASGDIWQNGIRDLSIYSPDTSHTKTALVVGPTSGFSGRGIMVGGPGQFGEMLGGAGSTALLTRGHEMSSFSDFKLMAQRPLVIGVNPVAYGSMHLDADQFHFSDMYLVANGFPNVTIQDGVFLSNVTFDGYEGWVNGTDGMYWQNTTRSAWSYNLILRNVRTEQGQGSGHYSINVPFSTGALEALVIDSMQLDPVRNGMYLRRTQWGSTRNTSYGGSGTVADVNNSNSHFEVSNCYFSGSVASGNVFVFGSGGYTTSLPPSAVIRSGY